MSEDRGELVFEQAPWQKITWGPYPGDPLPTRPKPNLLEVCPGLVVDRDKVEWVTSQQRSDGMLVIVQMVGGRTVDALWAGDPSVALAGMADLAEGRWRRRETAIPMHPGDLGLEEARE